MTPIVRRVPVKELGFGLRVAAHGVMVQADLLAGCLRLGDHAVGVRVDAGHETVVIHLSRAPRGADDNEVRLRVGDVDAALPVGHVDALHVGQGGRRRGAEQHGDDHGDDAGQHGRLAGLASSHMPRLALVEDGHSFLPFHRVDIEKTTALCRGQT